jgi:hypothetical protein
MAKSSITIVRAIGLALMVAGVGLAFWGYQTSESVGSQMTRAFTGSDTDEVMILYISGCASFVVGIYLFIKR